MALFVDVFVAGKVEFSISILVQIVFLTYNNDFIFFDWNQIIR